ARDGRPAHRQGPSDARATRRHVADLGRDHDPEPVGAPGAVLDQRRLRRGRGDQQPDPDGDLTETLRARMGAYRLHALYDPKEAATKKARAAFASRFDREVDPDGLLPAPERTRRA